MNIIIIVVAVLVLCLAYFALGVGTGLAGYSILKASMKFGVKPSTSASPATTGIPLQTWNIAYSPGMPATMAADPNGGWYFDFPSKDGIHYVQTPAPSLAVGRVIKMQCSITGDGTIVPTEVPEVGPRMRLYIQRQGDNFSGAGQYQQYRYWSTDYLDLRSTGDFEMTVALDPDKWSDVFGMKGTDFSGAFAACVTNASVIGFTFGGNFAGHGDYVINGNARFTLKSYTIT